MAYLPTPSADKGLAASLNMGSAPGASFRGFAGLAAGLAPLVVTKRARTGITQEGEAVVRAVAVLPLNVHAGPGRQVYFYRLGIGRRGHNFSIAHTSFAIFARPLPGRRKLSKPWKSGKIYVLHIKFCIHLE